VNVEIIIPTIRANPDMLAGCVEGVIETTGITPILSEGGTFAENCNAAAEGSAADVFVFLNDDTQPLTGWFEPLVAQFADWQVGIAGSRLVFPDGRIQHAGVYFASPDGVLTAYNHTTEQPSGLCAAVTGACMAVSRFAWRILGGFDPGFVNGYEDVDLCIRASRAGFHIRYAAESTVIHYESQSGPARWTHVRQNIARLQERWNA
jgi:GT2 family glycosyltransferase